MIARYGGLPIFSHPKRAIFWAISSRLKNMILKPDVNPFGIRGELLLALVIADGVWKDHGQDLVVTSLNDSTHSNTSLHYAGSAADLRTRYFTPEQAEQVADDLREALGHNPDYDVVLEKTHIHIEHQPKRRTA